MQTRKAKNKLLCSSKTSVYVSRLDYHVVAIKILRLLTRLFLAMFQQAGLLFSLVIPLSYPWAYGSQRLPSAFSEFIIITAM